MIEKRLFVGNLPLNISEKKIKKKFSVYGNVLDVEVKHRKDATDNIISTFAFVNIQADIVSLNDCINELSHQDWKGHTVKIEYAKENFLSRLEKERLENQCGEQSAALNHLKRKTDSQFDSEPKPCKVSSLDDSSSTSEKIENISEHTKYNGRLKMFSGTGNFCAHTSVGENEESKSSTLYNDDIIMKRFEAFSDVWKDSNEFSGTTMNVKRSFLRPSKTESGADVEDRFHKKSHRKSSDFDFEIARNEINHEGIVKQYISSDSDSEGSDNKETNMKIMHKGAKKFKKDDSSHPRTSGFDSKSTPLRRDSRRKDSDNFNGKDKKQKINGHIEDDTMDTEEVDQSLLNSMKHINPISQVSEERRQKSVLEKMKALNEQKKLIKNALRQVDSANRINKKIVFSDDDSDGGGGDNDEESDGNKNFVRKKSITKTVSKRNNGQQNLFDGSDSDMNDEMSNLKINKQFEGPKGEKLLELQSRYAHDDRFALDSRFYESDNEDSDEEGDTNRNNSESKAKGKDEKSKQLEVLEDVLGYQITKKPESDKKKKKHEVKEDTSLLRFDPTKSEHSKYVITKHPSTAQPSDRKKKKQEVVIDVPKNQTEVSKERFYKIDDSLKKSLKRSSAKSSGFSVLDLIGSKPNEDKNENVENCYTTELSSLSFKPKHQPRNPFRYDSSDTEEEENHPVDSNKQSAEENNTPFFGLWTDTFFLTDKDSRLKEADDFFMKNDSVDEKSEEDFTNRRNYLKSIVKWKSKNNLKNQEKQQFKTKLGGNSKRVKRKPRNISWKIKKFQNRRR